MNRTRKMLIKEKLVEGLNQTSMRKDVDNIPLLRSEFVKSSTKETEDNHGSAEEKPLKKRKELEWKPEDYAQPIGELIKFTGEGIKKKSHYEKFQFHDETYGLEDSVLLISEDANRKPYVAIIKDIYKQGKERYIKLEVQWFYRPEDVEEKYVGKWESKDARDLFYSFHCDEVFAESVKHKCIVYFVPQNKQIPNRKEHPGFIVQNVYNTTKKKLQKFTHNDFNEKQKHEIDLLVAKTMSRVGDLPDIEKEHKTLKSRPKRFIMKVQKTTGHTRSCNNVVNAPDYKSVLERFNMLTGDSDRDKRLEELLEVFQHVCRRTDKKKANDYDSLWPNDAVTVVCALEQAFHDSLAKDIPKHNHKLEILVDHLKNSRILAERLLNGELKPEKIITMTSYELMKGHTFDEMTAVIEEPNI